MRNNKNLKSVARIISDTPVDHMITKHGKKYFTDSGIELVVFPVKTFQDWKDAVLNSQEKHDAIYWGGIGVMKDFNQKEAVEFLVKNLKVPSISNGAQTTKFATFAVAKR